MLVVDLGKWMNKILIDWGIDAKVADRFDETIIAILMIAIAVGVDYLCQAILVGGMRQYTRRKPHLWNTLLMKRKVFHNLIHTIPAILVYALLPMAFMRGKELLVISQKACAIYITFSLLLAINGILLMIMDIYDGKETMKNRPMKGFIQVLQVLLFFIGGIVIISILVNKSPASLFAGLGASAAILMLVFKDSILGFVAGIQLSANDMVRPGDWITLPSGDANGTVQEITLNTVKIQNFDNTISTVPPYTLVSSPFQNWRGMKDSGGRRVMKNITLDLNGQTLTCEAGKDTITNEGTLVIVSSVEGGNVMGGTANTASGRTALLNKQGAVCTLKSGALKRGDVQQSGYYTVDNDGTLYMTGGEISNDSNSSSLVRNRGSMNVTGGLVRQDSFIALKNDEDTSNGIVGKLTIGGSAVIQSAGEQAVQNWGEATIEAGSITGEVFSWSYKGVNSTLDIKGGNIDGDVAGIDFEANKESTASVSISGGTVTGRVVVGNYSDGKVVSVEPDETSAKMEISGGAYQNDVSKFVAEGSSELVKASGGSRCTAKWKKRIFRGPE